MGLRGWIKRLEKGAREEMLEIPQKDGTIKRFPQSATREAFISLLKGRDHPLARAARASSSSEWSASFYSSEPRPQGDLVEDLSEVGP